MLETENLTCYIKHLCTYNEDDKIIMCYAEKTFLDHFEKYRKEIIDLKEKHIREQLIKAGWTPPNEEQ